MSTAVTTAARTPPEQDDLEAVLMRLRRAIDRETEPLYHRKDAGETDALPVLGRIALLVLELGFTIAEEGGIDSREIERAVSAAYGLPTG
ncbi:hypothetical protein [Saccharomonospora saliphila]|uniref:hypothetical protein n=1 Tax=Saccharomonospora saliphila TaxID=369829 RepID=UPI000373EA8A|nr:hypothetical protein [Saccharomonospora saliphila]